MVDIFFTFFENPLEQSLFSDYMSVLSPELKEKNSRYIRWQNRHSHLFGKLLFLEAVKKYGIEKNIWDLIKYNSYERPYLTLKEFDFNISHSGNYVICAIGRNIKLGIDIEKNRNINFENFTQVMSPCQWEAINSSNFPIKQFFKYWAIKESVIKADGRGLAIPLDELEVNNSQVHYDDKLWFVQELKIDANYSSTLATNKLVDFKFHEISFYNKEVESQIISRFEG